MTVSKTLPTPPGPDTGLQSTALPAGHASREAGSWRSRTIWVLVLLIAAIIAGRTLLARQWNLPQGNFPRLNDLFTLAAVFGSVGVLIPGFISPGYRVLRRKDWLIALALGAVVGVTMLPATLFSPYPFLNSVAGNGGQAAVRGVATAAAALGGLVIYRLGGPVRVRSAAVQAAVGSRAAVGSLAVLLSLAFGAVTGLPLAALNVYALSITQGRPVAWQSPVAALVDALQPGIVEEVVYRFALLGLVWLLLRRSSPHAAGWQAGLLALLAHTFMHFDDLYLEAPLMALGMGAVTGLIWGLPMTLLALRRDLESAVAFHWIQDAARFLAGF
jgi:hypothetical protein